MKTVSTVALAGVLALGLATAAQAQSTSPYPSVPNPANPYPLNPVASDGSPLYGRYNGVGVYSGRSAYVAPGYGAPGVVDGAVDGGLGLAGAGVDTGLGLAGAGLGAAGDVLR